MYIGNYRWHLIEGSRGVEAQCGNCNNLVIFRLHYAKEGIGLSVPIAPLFTDKLTWAKKSYYLVCPTCSAADKITKEVARTLGGL